MEKVIVAATHNKGKIVELRRCLSSWGIEVKQLPLGAVEPEETGQTFYENALIKARAAVEITGMPCLADDSGLCVGALEGAPGIYSARYGGCKCSKELCEYLLCKMEGIENRAAYFYCEIVCLFPDGKIITASGRCDGEILLYAKGEGGFGYDPVFYYPPLGKTMAELSLLDKNTISHRGKALRGIKKRLYEEMCEI